MYVEHVGRTLSECRYVTMHNKIVTLYLQTIVYEC